MDVDQRAPACHSDRTRLTSFVVLLSDRDVGRIAQRTIRPERANEPRDPIRVRSLARRKHPAEDERQIALLHLSPLPRDALPEPPVVVVIPGSPIERDPLAVNIELAVQET